MDAFALGITKLATRISEMRAEGMEFEQKWESHINMFGEKSYYMRYSLPKPKGGTDGRTEDVHTENH